MKKTVASTAFLFAIAASLPAWNYFDVHAPAARSIAEDSRNEKISMWVYHRYGVLPGELVMDLRRFDENAAPLDVIRVLLQGARGLKDKQFERVVLAYKGNPKFFLRGEFFSTLGREYDTQNPVYTLRTLPENVYRLDGTQAFGTWTGGILGVLGKQMEDLGQFSKDWYIQDFAREQGSR